jgi:probable addiction module antidote protein
MKYDRLGFPIPPEFAAPSGRDIDALPAPRGTEIQPPQPRRRAGRGKQIFLLGVLAAVVVPGLLAPGILPVISDVVVEWSLERAMVGEARGNIPAALGDIARAKGMTQIARDAGLGRESLYKALSADGNPEFSTIMKVVAALGLRLHASPARVGG